jgi:hypothetical protein
MFLRLQPLSQPPVETKLSFSDTPTTLDSAKKTANNSIPLSPNSTSTHERITALHPTQPDANQHKDLWDKAYFRLRDEKKELVETYESILVKNAAIPESLPLKDKMKAVVDNGVCVMTNRQWKIRIPWRQEPVIVRDLVDKIVKIVLKFKDIGSLAASIDPIHAGLPFAGICTLLQVCDLPLLYY